MLPFSPEKLKNTALTEQFIRRTPLLYQQTRSFFRRMEQASLEGRRHLQKQRIQRILKKAAKLPYYREMCLPCELEAWPYVTKEDFRAISDDLAATSTLPKSVAATGGTTGIPLKLNRSWGAIVAEQVSLDLLAHRAGVNLATAKTAVLRGDTIKNPSDMTPPFWVFQAGGRRLVLSSNHLQAKTAPLYREALLEFAPEVLNVYPSSLEAFCGLIDAPGKIIPSLKLVISSSEVLRSDIRGQASKRLAVPVFDHYGQAERVNLAQSVETGQFYFSPAYGVNELEYRQSDENYDYYEIIGTSLWNISQILIRYKTGDLAILPKNTSNEDCLLVSFGLKPFFGVAGRTSEYIETPSGAHIIGINQIPRGLEGIIQMQFIQRAKDRVEIRVIPQDGFTETLRNKILQQARTKIPDSVALDIYAVERIERTIGGKAPLLIREFQQ